MLKTYILLLTTCLYCATALAGLRLPSILSNGAVLQHGKPISIWGWASPGAEVRVQFLGKTYPYKTNAAGEWRVALKPAKAGAGGDMLIAGDGERVLIKNILIGEVWICSGQSNMEFTMNAFKDFYAAEIAASQNSSIRFAVLKQAYDNVERTDAELSRGWTAVNPSTIGDCSAVAWFYAKKLNERLKVPVGLIVTAWGGTPAQAWMDTGALKPFKNYNDIYAKSIKPVDFSKLEQLRREEAAAFRKNVAEESAKFKSCLAVEYNDNHWEPATLPGNWEQAGHPDFDGIAACRIKFTVPETAAGKEATLYLPAIDDIDSTYINGVFIGSHTVWNERRTYNIPEAVLKAGVNMLTIWVEDGQGGGGLASDADHFYVQAGDMKIPLAGPAKFKELLALKKGVQLGAMQNSPAVLFNAMIAPLLPASFRGVIWYQGESNASQYKEYRTLFPGLISNWRSRFGTGVFPFLFVQLSSYNPAAKEPEISDWAFLREAQAMALRLPNTGMAVTTDVGDRYDIHPKQKKEVGERLASQAFKKVYGYKNIVAEGPSYKTAAVTNGGITLSFHNTGGGLVVNGAALNGFAIAGADKKFYPAQAVINGGTVTVSSARVAAPLYVRYAWANAPLEANLYNKEGFPAAPFRTDK